MTLALNITLFISILAGLLCLVIAWRCWRSPRETAIGYCAHCGRAIQEGDRCVALSPEILFCSVACETAYRDIG